MADIGHVGVRVRSNGAGMARDAQSDYEGPVDILQVHIAHFHTLNQGVVIELQCSSRIRTLWVERKGSPTPIPTTRPTLYHA